MHRTSLLPAAVIAVVLGAVLFLHHRHYQRVFAEAERRSTDAAYAIHARQNAFQTELKRNFNQLPTSQRDIQQAETLLNQLASNAAETNPDEESLRRRQVLIQQAREFAGRFQAANDQCPSR